MTFSDYLIDIALIGIVLLQVRGRRLTLRTLLLPIGLVGWAASAYLKSMPTAGNDLVLIGLCAAAGTVLGAGAGLTTRVTRSGDGTIVARAGFAAAGLWILGMGFRLAFQLYATHGGAASIGRFSITHHITTDQAWVAALVLMAILEALARTAVLAVRAWQEHRAILWTGPSSGIMAVGERVA